jgi:hypothetical protein
MDLSTEGSGLGESPNGRNLGFAWIGWRFAISWDWLVGAIPVDSRPGISWPSSNLNSLKLYVVLPRASVRMGSFMQLRREVDATVIISR